MSMQTLKIGYTVIGAALLILTANTVYQASSALHTNQKLQTLERERVQLEVAKATLDTTIATQTALTPIQKQLSGEFVPITAFYTAVRHSTVALR